MKYRLPRLEDKNIITLYIQEHYARGEENLSATNMLTSMPFEEWIKKINDNLVKPDKEWGKSLTYLIFDEEKLVGFLSVRYDLPIELASIYGHIGYGIRPSERGKGYATKALQFGLEECRKQGMKKVILGCHKENIASAKSIIKNGGKLIKEVDNFVNVNNFYNINLINQYYEIIL